MLNKFQRREVSETIAGIENELSNCSKVEAWVREIGYPDEILDTEYDFVLNFLKEGGNSSIIGELEEKRDSFYQNFTASVEGLKVIESYIGVLKKLKRILEEDL